MISATAFVSTLEGDKGFSAIARSVMISAVLAHLGEQAVLNSFSAIARSVMISAFSASTATETIPVFQCYSS